MLRPIGAILSSLSLELGRDFQAVEMCKTLHYHFVIERVNVDEEERIKDARKAPCWVWVRPDGESHQTWWPGAQDRKGE